ncbi:hypothetical protein [Labilibaculum antarcticum]|nr:hypothetical protein [Labilibaculum antarcticum]
MKRNDFVPAMFEEIKETMAAINKKLQQEKPDEKEPQKEISRQLLEFIYQSIHKSVRENISVSEQSTRKQLNQLTQDTKDLEQRITEMTGQYKKRRLIFRKLVVWQSVAAVLFLLGIGLFVNNRQLRDNDLKFKFIQAQGGINSNGLSYLDTVFHVNRNELVIEKIKKKVEVGEKESLKKADDISCFLLD